MKSKHLIFVHVAIWLIYFLGKGYYIDLYWYDKAEGNPFYWYTWIGSRLFDVFSAYLTLFFFKVFFLKKKHFVFSLIVVIHFVFHYAYDSWCWNWYDIDYLWVADGREQQLELIGATAEIHIIGLIFFVTSNWTGSFYKRKKLEDEVMQTELKFLKSQMSPHFLFNVLNNIYSLSLDGNKKTSNAIGQLKSIMSYIQVFESKSEISLKEENRYLQDYIELNKLRYQVKVRLKSSFHNEDLKIEPMIFLPLFENAFKHGKTENVFEIRAYIKEVEGVVSFEIVNDADLQKRKDHVSGVGLENIKKRLPYLYSDFWMDVIQHEGKYKVKLRFSLAKKVKL